MGAFFVYILKTSVCLAGFYLFYRLLLSRETFHRFNRYALLGVWFISLAIPLFETGSGSVTEMQQSFTFMEEKGRLKVPENTHRMEYRVIPQEAPYARSFFWLEYLLLIYPAGFLFFLLRNVYSLIRLVCLMRKSKSTSLGEGITLVIHERNLSPFSWMKRIFVSDRDLAESKAEILLHEREHIRQYHSFDLLLAELAILFQWFNPAAWLYKQALQNLHEYQADAAVVRQGTDLKQYQLLLIKKAVGSVRFNSLANSFNHSKLKKRITMMSKRKSNPKARWKYLYVLPVAAITAALFARAEVSGVLGRISTLKVKDLVSETKAGPEKKEQIRGERVVLSSSYVPDSGENPVKSVFSSSGVTDGRWETLYSTRVETFLKDSSRSRIIAGQVDFTVACIGEDTLILGKRMQYDGQKAVNTRQESFPLVMQTSGSYGAPGEAAVRTKVILIPDGVKGPGNFPERSEGKAIASGTIGGGRVYVSSVTGERIHESAGKSSAVYTIREGEEINVKKLEKEDSAGEPFAGTEEDDPSGPLGPEDRKGTIYVGRLSGCYPSGVSKKDSNTFIYRKSNFSIKSRSSN